MPESCQGLKKGQLLVDLVDIEEKKIDKAI